MLNTREFAAIGAKVRYEELKSELEAIVRAFPGLNGAKAVNAQADAAVPKTRKRRISAAERKAISERMTRYWAAQRAKNEKGQAAKATRPSR